MDKFEEWFESQYFYTNMRFIHGDGLFIKDGEVYRVLPVQMSWKSWQSRKAELDQAYEDIETFAQAHQRECDIKVQIANELKEKDKRIEELEKQLKRSMIAIKDGEIDWALKNIKKTLRGDNANS